MTLRQRFADLASLGDSIDSIYFAMPVLLSAEFADPPHVERVDGYIGSSYFRWELATWQMDFDITSQPEQELKVSEAWRKLAISFAEHRRRLMASLACFYVACRLRREEKTPGEFAAEAIMNLSKCLETLFGPKREVIRDRLLRLDYKKEEVERDFIPIILLRNQFDVAHPSLALLTPSQLLVVHRYSDQAERVFRDLFRRLFVAIEEGKFDVEPKLAVRIDSDLERIINRLQENVKPL